MNYSCLNILSIGCGAAPDLIAFDKQVINKPINYTGIDPNVLWGDVQQDIKNFFSVQGNHYIQFLPLCISQWFNVVVIEYLLSAFVDSERANYARQLFDGIISYVLMQRSDNEPFLIVLSDVDSINDGRPYFHWLLNKLEDAGYSGRVLARSAYPEGDLGANRWGMQNTQRKETFAYSYEQVMQHQPAQLIIEVS
jgi:hypothetical protein